MPPLQADPDAWVGTVIAVVLIITRSWLLHWTWLDHQWVERENIQNGRRIIGDTQYKVQALRLSADALIVLFEVLALISPEPVAPGLVYKIARAGVLLLLPSTLLAAAILEAHMRRRLFRR